MLGYEQINQDLLNNILSGYVSVILNKRKPMILEIARLFHNELGIPGDILLS